MGYDWPEAEADRYVDIYATVKDICFVAEEEGKVVGAALAYVQDEDPGVLHIEILEPDSGQANQELVNAVLAVARRRKKKGLRKQDSLTVEVVLFVPAGQRSETMKQQGFVLSPPWVYCTMQID